MEWWNGKYNGENSGPLTSLPVDRLTATDCNADSSCQKDKYHWNVRGPTPGLGGADKWPLPKDGQHHPLISRFHPTSGLHDLHSVRVPSLQGVARLDFWVRDRDRDFVSLSLNIETRLRLFFQSLNVETRPRLFFF